MTPKEAINDLLSRAALSEPMEVAVRALRYRTPEKPYRNEVYYPHMPNLLVVQCPTCKRRLRTKRTCTPDAFCPTCGQAIDWEGIADG